MAQLTRDQVKAWNTANKNGFEFDITYFLYHSEKTISKNIETDPDHVITVHLMYRSQMETKTNSYGCKWTQETGKLIPVAHFAKALRQRDCLVSHGLGYWHDMGDPVDKKSYAALQKLTEQLDDETCLSIFGTLAKTKVNQYA